MSVRDDLPSEASGLKRAVWTYLSEQVEVIVAAEPQLRDHQGATEGDELVHDTRVAVRRFRSTLRVFADLFDEDEAVRMGDELRWWAGVLGVVRDLEVLEARLTAQLDELPPELVLGPVRREILTALQLQRQNGWTEIGSTLESPRHQQLIADLHRWRSDPPLTERADRPAKAVRAFLKRANKKVRRRLARAGEAHRAAEPDSDHLFHQARKAGKRHRYAAELAQPVLGDKADKAIAKRKELQDVLGDHQDGSVAAAFLRAEGARLGSRSGHNGFTYGVLYGREIATGAAVLDRLAKL